MLFTDGDYGAGPQAPDILGKFQIGKEMKVVIRGLVVAAATLSNGLIGLSG